MHSKIMVSVDEFTLLLFPTKEMNNYIWKPYCQSIVNRFLELSKIERFLGQFEITNSKLQAGYTMGLTVVNKPYHCGIYWNSDIYSMAVCVKNVRHRSKVL